MYIHIYIYIYIYIYIHPRTIADFNILLRSPDAKTNKHTHTHTHLLKPCISRRIATCFVERRKLHPRKVALLLLS